MVRNSKTTPNRGSSHQRANQPLHMTKNRNIVNNSPRMQQAYRVQLLLGIQHGTTQYNLQQKIAPFHASASSSQRNPPRNALQRHSTANVHQQNNQMTICSKTSPVKLPLIQMQGNFSLQQLQGYISQQMPIGSRPKRFVTQNQLRPSLQFINNQITPQSPRGSDVSSNDQVVRDENVLGPIKDKNGELIKDEKDIKLIRKWRKSHPISYSFELVSGKHPSPDFQSEYEFVLIYPLGYREYIGKLTVNCFYTIPSGIKSPSFICPRCIHYAGCLCSVCKLENNRFAPIPKYKLILSATGSPEYKFVYDTLNRTALNVSFKFLLQNVFKIVTEFKGISSDPADSRLFFHGTSVEEATKILTSGFQILPNAFSSERFGHGCYLTPCSSAAVYHSAIASRSIGIHTKVQYIFVCEIRRFRDLSTPRKSYREAQVSQIDHYHGRLTFDTETDRNNPEGIPISQGLMPRFVETLYTSMLTDEIVVRNDDFIRPVYLARILTNEYENLECNRFS